MSPDAATGRVRRYRVPVRLPAPGEEVPIEDAGGLPVYRLETRVFAFRTTLLVRDLSGQTVARIRRPLPALRETVVIERTGYPTATVRRALSSLFRPRYRVDSAGGDLEVVGDIIGREYAIRRGGMEAARISRGPVSVRECYGVEVAPGEDAVLMLSVAVALQAFRTGAQVPPVTRAGPDLSR